MSIELQALYAQPHRAYFTAYCKEHQIALASHDDTTVAHVEQAFAEGATVCEFPTTVAAARPQSLARGCRGGQGLEPVQEA
ncbi:hypothetical protein JZU56_04335, partial [bacterium]|nr:hypothetical protein [bacterium]